MKNAHNPILDERDAPSRERLTGEPLAHLDEHGRAHLLIEHLTAVGGEAGRLADRFGAGDWARLAGLWHDLGKYAKNFQKMIREANGYEAHIEGDASGPRDHSSAGAIHAFQKFGNAGLPISFVIAGHHAGLSNRNDLEDRLRRKKDCYEKAKVGGAPISLLEASLPPLPARFRATGSPALLRRLEMWTRMLFSAVCDADFLDTEAFFDPARASLRGARPSLSTLEERLTEYLADLQAKAEPSEVNRVRADVLKACLEKAPEASGAFSLTVPTGGGKTLASLAFALAHARAHNLDRVIVVIPFTSIIEQSAAVYRQALKGEDAVLEHHSAFDPARETPKNRVASENWDAPVVVTTTVQLFESLFANRPRSCRKLHNLARSVIILDEAQTLPPAMLSPILDGLQTLISDFGASVVISTATQPVLHRIPRLKEGLQNVREIVPAEVRAFERLRRVQVRWPDMSGPTSYEAVAVEAAKERDVLVIVHRRDDARDLCAAFDTLLNQKDTLHLSALMCAEHRSHVLAMIKERKLRGEPVRLVSTQLVEAGVDVDFAIVYRALGGLDSLAQAAGRCNREGRLKGLGELRIFEAPTRPPQGVPVAALEIAHGMLSSNPALDLFANETFTTYFSRLYMRNLDEKKIQEARAALSFKDVAENFKIIEDDWSAPIVVPYGDVATHVAALEHKGPSRGRLRALQRFTVNVRRDLRDKWLGSGCARMVCDTVVVLNEIFASAYTKRFGLIPDRVGVAGASALIVD